MIENLIFEAIVGSVAYGTNVETSDLDKKGVFLAPIDDLISFGYVEQINVTKDEAYYEVRRFLELCSVGNPTCLELLFSDDECILQTSPQFELIRQNRYKFLTKKCATSFGFYGMSQIKKAASTGKKFNIEDSKMVHKTPFDFTYYYKDDKSFILSDYLKQAKLLQEKCGLVRIDHMKDCYALYYDYNNLGYRGIIGEKSNEIRLSSIPKGEISLLMIYYNVEAYSKYMKEYKEYNQWLENRNVNRFVDVINHGQEDGNSRIDGKNMSHTVRLLNIAREISETSTFSVKRPNAEYLLQIKRGEVPLKEIMEYANKEIAGLEELYKNSNLPDEVDPAFVKELLLKIRKM
jgi:predicted nucleotidyltransferase